VAKASVLRTRRPITAPVTHIALPGYEIARTQARRVTVATFLRRSGWATKGERGWEFHNTPLPTICTINGELVRRRDWRKRKILSTDQVQFISRPMGGMSNPTQIAGLIAVIALTAFAPYLGGLAAGAVGATFTGAGALFGAGIAVAGSLLVSTLLRPKTADQAEGKPVDQIYTVAASGNLARPLQPIKPSYGRIKTFPDYCATPWSEFEGNDQYLNLLLCTGLGEYAYEELLIDDTPFWTAEDGLLDSFDNVQIAFYAPGENVTLFPLNVVSATEVSGQQLEGGDLGGATPSGGGNISVPGDWVGGFIVAAAGTTTNTLALDFVFPSGVFSEDSGGIHAWTVPIRIEYRPVDAAGAPLAAYAAQLESFTYQTKTPQRATVKIPVFAGRYQVRVRKENSEPYEPSGVQIADDVNWVGLRAFLSNSPTSFAGVSTVAIRIKANNQLSGSGSHRFAVLRTRKLLVYDFDLYGGWSPAPVPTRNPFWAFYDAATNTDYGAERDSSKIDFSEVYAHALAADARGDTFDYEFTGAVPFPEAFDTILKPARSWHKWSGDQLGVVRDEWRAVPQLMLTDRETVRGSVEINLALNEQDSADAVVIEYLDEATWGMADVQYPPPGEVAAVNPSRRRIDGIVNREHAFREAAFYWRQSQIRRTAVSLDTEYDGRVVGLGSHVAVQCELPVIWGSSGRVVSRSVNTLTLDPAPAWGSGQHYINIRTRLGRPFGPVMVSIGADPTKAVLDATDLAALELVQGTLADALQRAADAEEPSFSHGTSLARGIVMSGRPNGETMSLVIVLDTQEVHGVDIGSPPEPAPIDVPVEPRVPTIIGLHARFVQGVAEATLHASWQPSRGAKGYIAEISYDAGDNWEHFYDGVGTNFQRTAQLSNLRLRVQAISKATDLPGPSSFVDVTKPTIKILGSLIDFTTVDLTPIASSIVPIPNVGSLPDPTTHTPPPYQVFLTTDRKLYRFVSSGQTINGITGPAWIASVSVVDLFGQIDTTQIAENAVDFTRLASGIDPIATVTSLPAVLGYTGPRFVFLTTDSKIYRLAAGAWTAGVAAVDVTGQLTNSQIADIAAAKLTGQISSVQITDSAISAPKISAGAVEAGKIAAGAVTADAISAGAITAGKIAAAAVAANEIAANSITSAKIVADAVTAGKIAAAAVNAREIAAGAVTAGKLAVGAYFQNLLLNGSFEDDLLYWTDASAAPCYVAVFANTAIAVEGSKILQLTNGGSGFAHVVSVFIPIIGGQKYEGRAWINGSGTSTTGAYVGIDWYDAAFSFLSSSIVYDGGIAAKFVANLVTAPGAAKYATFNVRHSPASGLVALYADALSLRKASGATTIEDDAITTGKIAANQITAAKIAANTITASEINANSVRSAVLIADSVQAGMIAAAAVNAREIAAGAITAGKLAVGDYFQNLLLNGSFEDDMLYWTAADSSPSTSAVVVSPGAAKSGTKVLQQTNGGGGYCYVTSQSIPIVGSQWYEARSWLGATAVGSTGVNLQINWYDTAGAYLGTVNAYDGGATVGFVSGLVQAPSSAKIATVSVFHNSTSGVAAIWWDMVSLRKATGGTLIEDGAITTNKIVADAIVSSHIASDAIVAEHITAGIIDTHKLAVNGVELTNILDGAATAVHYTQDNTNYDIRPSNGLTLIHSTGSFTVAGSGRTVFMVSINTGFGGQIITNATPIPDWTFGLYVDGVNVQNWIYSATIKKVETAGSSGWSNIYSTLVGVLSMTFRMNLAAGAHYAEVKATPPTMPAVGGGVGLNAVQYAWQSSVAILQSRK
jgi:hypothetical protein